MKTIQVLFLIVLMTSIVDAQLLEVTPDSRNVGATSGTTSFTVSSFSEWSVRENANWLTAVKTTFPPDQIAVNYDANPLAESRTADIIVTNSLETVVVQVIQDGNTFLEVIPPTRNVSESAGRTTFTVNSTLPWSVSETANWLTADQTSSDLITVDYDANSQAESREADIKVTNGREMVVVQVIQAENIDIYVTPTSRNVSETSGRTTFTVSSNLPWSVSETSSWLTAYYTSSDLITVDYDANSQAESREADIRVTNGAQTVVVQVIQDGNPMLEVTPPTRNVTASDGTTDFNVSANQGWEVSDNADWLTATPDDDNRISVTYSANASTDSRTATITVKGDVEGICYVTVVQERVDPSLSVSPDVQEVDSIAGRTTFNVNSALLWSVSETANWLTAVQTSSSLITVDYNANSQAESREADIRVTNGAQTVVVQVIQDGNPMLDVTPSTRNVTASDGTTDFNVSANQNWEVHDNVDWLLVGKEGNNRINVTYSANISTSSRTATITVEGYVEGVRNVTVFQEGVNPSLSVSPDVQEVGSNAGTTDFYVTSNVDWSVTDNADWLTAIKTSLANIQVNYEANNSTSQRTGIITITGTGLSPQTVTLIQEGNTVNPISDIIENQNNLVYPNPTSDILYIKPDPEITGDIVITVFDLSGTLIFSQTSHYQTSREIIRIDLSNLNTGLYLIKLNDSSSHKIRKL